MISSSRSPRTSTWTCCSRIWSCRGCKKTQLNQLMEMKTYRAGYTSNGVPANINVVRSLQNSLARRMALQAGRNVSCVNWRSAWPSWLAQKPNDHFAEMAQLEKEIRS